MGRKLLSYGIALGIGLAIALSVAAGRGAFYLDDQLLMWQYLSDGCFVASVVLLSAGLLAFVASDGLFDMLGFGIKKLFSLFQRDDRKLSGTFFEYKCMKQARRSGGYGFLIIIGALFLAAAAFFLIQYFRVDLNSIQASLV